MVRVLLVGATGTLGQEIALACVREGHKVFALVRAASRRSKATTLSRLTDAGVETLDGDLENTVSISAAFAYAYPVEVVISAVSGGQVKDQTIIVQASLEAKTVTRLIPSEFGVDHSSAKANVPAITAPRQQIHKELRDAGIPFTLVHANGFAQDWAAGLGQIGAAYPPNPVIVFGDGTVPGFSNKREDIAAYVAKTLDDPRTVNKRLIVAPPKNRTTQLDLIRTWERVSGQSVKRTYMSAEEIETGIQGGATSLKVSSNYSAKTYLQLAQAKWICGDSAHDLPPDALEASVLYPDWQYTTLEEYLMEVFRAGPQ